MNEDLDSLKNFYKINIIKQTETIKRLIAFIKKACDFQPISKIYQNKWIDLIDKEIESGVRDASFWKNKYRKF